MQPITAERALITELNMAESTREITFKKSRADAVILMAEMLQCLFKVTAQRTIKQAEAEDCDRMDIEHFEKIPPQLVCKYTPVFYNILSYYCHGMTV
ncbi:centromere protein X [Salvelinus sp. IW2-2015]|uniref:centromere protein X n=1 Tax=Salvelinus sp. IW2-2015 TaxID=2691554 RepID=UPI0038D3F627